MFNDNSKSMLSKQIHQDYETQVSVITRAWNNRSATGINIDKGSKKGMKNIIHTDAEYAQDGKHLPAEWESTLNESNSITNTKKMKKVNSSWSNLQLNETPRKLKISSTLSDGNKDNLYATELSNSPVVSTLELRKRIRNLRSSSTNLYPTKNYTINSSKALTAPRMMTLITNSHPELQEDNARFKSNNMLLMFNVSDTVLASTYDSLNHNTAMHYVKTRSKNVPLAAMKDNSEKCTKFVKMVLRSPKSKFRNSKSINLTQITASDFHCTNKKRVCPLNGNSATLIKNYITSVKRDINVGQTTNIDMIDTFKENAYSVKGPIVLVQKLHNIVTFVLSPQSLSSSMVRIHVNDQFVNCNVNVSRKTYDSVLGRLVTTEICHSKKTDSCTKIWQNMDSQRDSMENLCYVRGSTSEPLPELIMSSTPKDQQGLNETASKRKARKIKHECDTTLELNTNNAFLTQCQDHGSVKADEAQGEVKQQNETYELIEPKTPNLRKRLEEKCSDGGKKGVKKNVKVRFTRSPMDTNDRLQCHAQYSEEKSFKSLMNKKKKILKSPVNGRQRGPNSISGRDESAAVPHTPCSKIGHSAKSFAKVNIANASQSVTHTRQLDPKYFSVAKKVPNFATIHKNIFAKSESILDAKKRLRDKHTALTMAKVKNSMKIKPNLGDEKQLSSEGNTESCNRFGFKMRKREATDCILRNNNIHVTRSKERRRAILNGVRINRRFELQMKLRNIDL